MKTLFKWTLLLMMFSQAAHAEGLLSSMLKWCGDRMPSFGLSQSPKLTNSVLSGSFDGWGFVESEKSGISRGGGVRIDYTSNTVTTVPQNLSRYLDQLGFKIYGSPESPRDIKYYAVVPFGKKLLYMIVSVDYSQSHQLSDPVYEPAENGGRVFMGHGHQEVRMQPRFLKVQFQNDTTWSIYQTWAPEYPWNKTPYAEDKNLYSYDTLTARAKLASDLTKQAVGRFRSDGFEAYGFNDFIPDVDMEIVRGDSSLHNTDPVHLKFDPRGHALVYINNFARVMKLSDKDFAKLRGETPHYRQINLREGYRPENGAEYAKKSD